MIKNPSCYPRWQQYNTCLVAPSVTGKGHCKIKVMEIDMMRIDPGAIGFTSGFSQEHKYSTVGEQITVEQLIELRIVMRISRHDHVYTHHIHHK